MLFDGSLPHLAYLKVINILAVNVMVSDDTIKHPNMPSTRVKLHMQSFLSLLFKFNLDIISQRLSCKNHQISLIPNNLIFIDPMK